MATAAKTGVVWVTLDRDEIPVENTHGVAAAHCHVTLEFKADLGAWAPRLGLELEVVVEAVCFDGDIQAAVVRLPEGWGRTDGGVPHVTLSMREGVKPFASNKMLAGEHERLSVGPVILKGVVEAVAHR